MKVQFIISCSLLFFSISSTSMKAQEKPKNNPLLQKSNLQYQAPRFDLIRDEHFEPAFEYALKIHDKEIEKIEKNNTPPTFENTVLAIELSGEDLTRATTAFYNLTGSNTNPTLQAIEEKYAPIFSAHSDKLYLNEKIYKRIKALSLNSYTGEKKKLVEYYLQQFELAGANLSADKKEIMKQINQDLATLSTTYSNKLLLARKNAALIFDDPKALEGLGADELEAAASAATEAGHKGSYMISMQNTTQQPILKYLKNRATREAIFNSSWTRAEKNDEADTRNLIMQMVALRLQKAQLMGYKNFAEWKLIDQMAKNPKNAMNLLKSLAAPAVAKARREIVDIQKQIDEQKGGFKLMPWDWDFYAEQVRKQKYDLDESIIKPYFEVNSVLENGVFYAAKLMYGITFKERKDLPVYHPDVVAYEVFDKDGKSLALYYLDFYTRDNKSGGAWMNNFVGQSHILKQNPVIVNVYNFQKPAPGKPSLISYDDVSTMFHEFGHTLHGLFANQQYPSLSGTNVPRDFVELPSQINEHCALEPSILKNYAIHYQTKKVIPEELIQKIKNAETFNKGYEITELLAASVLDMAWHTIEDKKDIIPVLDFEKQALMKYNLLVDEVPTRYHSPYFAHIFGGGYSAGYYAYTWSKVLDYNAYDYMEANGGMNFANGERFRKMVLSVGNSVDLNEAFKKFVGHEMDIKPCIKYSGL